MKSGYVYILTNRYRGVLYIGVTGYFGRRLQEHLTKVSKKSFSSRYKLWQLVYYEKHTSIIEAITREKQLKTWNREWKIALIESVNPDWDNLIDQIYG